MPSTSKRQRNFMAALAHNPSFAKKVGVPQSVGKDFNEADKGRKFGRGGAALQKINKQDTKHGKLDLPVANLNRMVGMKEGGTMMSKRPMRPPMPGTMGKRPMRPPMGAMPPQAAPMAPGMKKGGKVKRYADGDLVENNEQGMKDAERGYGEVGSSLVPGLRKNQETGEYYNPDMEASAPAKAAPRAVKRVPAPAPTAKPAPTDKPAEAAAPSGDIRAPRSGETPGGAQAGRVSSFSRNRKMPTDAEKEASSERMGDVIGAAASLVPAGAAAGAVYKGMRGAMALKRLREASKAGEAVPKDFAKMSLMERAKATGGYKKGGSVKGSKVMGMKSGGLPMVKKGGKMVPSFAADGKGRMNMGGMAGMKKMNMGGMAKYAKGGGIESRGKTKGTIIKMAAGGSVSARADGIAQRGKTKFKNY